MAAKRTAAGHDGPALCGAKKKQGEGTCGQVAGWGVPGVTTGPCKLHGGATPTHRRAAEVAMARQACVTLGVQVPIDPAEALLDELRRTYGNVLYYESLVAALAQHPADGEGKPHVLVGLYNAERKHYAQVAAAALSAGVAQRVIELAEDTARQVVGVLSEFARRLGLDPSAPEVREAGREALQLVAGGRGG